MPSSSSCHRSQRPELPHSTFVLPKTGQRLKGLVNLRNGGYNNGNVNGDHERQGLLSGEVEDSRHGASAGALGRLLAPWTWSRQFLTSELGVGVLKCSLAYLLGSLATFIPAISAFLGHQDGKHMVATVTVYFHPARSRGSMYRALVCALLAFLYAAFISITSMLVTMSLRDVNLLPVGHALVLIVFCGGGLGFIGWTKQRLGDPLVNVACSLASLAIITVLTKEGSVQSGDLSFAKIFQVLKMVLMGVTATMTVSFLIFPISARKKLRANLVTVTGSLASMLAIITESFLSGSEEELLSTEFVDAATRHKKAYGQLDRLVREAKLEHYILGTTTEYRLEKKLVRCVQDITHNLGGLRSAAVMQFQLLKQTKSGDAALPKSHDIFHRRMLSPCSLQEEDELCLDSIDEGPERGTFDEDDNLPGSYLTSRTASLGDEPISHPADIFEIFINHLGPSMRSLAFTLKEIFQEVPFGPAPDYGVSVDAKFRLSLDRALQLYRESRQAALTSLYRQKEIVRIQTLEVEADLEEVSASCGHFSFSLLEFGEELKVLLSILDELHLEVEERPNGKSWSWLKFWHWNEPEGDVEEPVDFGEQPHNSDVAWDTVRGNNSSNFYEREGRTPLYPHGFADMPGAGRVGYRIWKSLGFFRRDDTKYAIKVGTGAAMYALPSFLSSTRPFYAHWRGEWGLLSYMLVCSMTIGSSNTTGYARFSGTSLGATCAIVSWYVSEGNPVGLAFLGFLMSTWTSYIILVKGRGPMGRFIMLTYNLSVLYAYSLSQRETSDDDDEGGDNPIITEIALHRVMAVLSGCIWGIIITRLIWPISARERLKHSLSLLWLRMSLIWKRDPLSAMARDKTSAAIYMTPREKLEIERYLTRLESLQVSARSEFELKSAFPDATYSSIIRRTRTMIDSFHAMNLELVNNLTASEGEIAILRYTARERQSLSARISHLLSVMASSMNLEYPLSDNLPSINHARDRLLARIFHYRNDQAASRLTTDEDYALLYAYTLVTGQLSNEIMEIMGEIGRLFGMLNEDVVKLQ